MSKNPVIYQRGDRIGHRVQIADRCGHGKHKRCKIPVRCRREMGTCKKMNKGGRSGDIKVTMRDSDVCIALSTSWSRHYKARVGGRYGGRFFPAVLRGALDVPAARIIDDMYAREAVAVGTKAVGLGLAGRKMGIQELDAVVREKIFEVE